MLWISYLVNLIIFMNNHISNKLLIIVILIGFLKNFLAKMVPDSLKSKHSFTSFSIEFPN